MEWKKSVLDFVGAAFSHDRFNSRLKAAPTGVFYRYFDKRSERIDLFKTAD
jgi:hypothetical protein